MDQWIYLGNAGFSGTDLPTLLLSLLLAFLAGQLMAWVYMFTHTGLSYSRTYVNSLIIIPITVSLVMTVLDNNLVTAFSLMAVFAIVRFRNIVRDTLDTVYILTLIVIGMAAGTQLYTSTVIGAIIFATIMLYLWYTNFGARQRYDFIINLHWSRPEREIADLLKLLNRHSMKVQLASQRSSQAEDGTDLSYRLLLRDPDQSYTLLEELRGSTGVSRVTALRAEEESEI
ncbi:MAG: DUF4956 domain-containing protein [Rhodothermaceae bacterium]|nr:DUF4956 domain-containing protein [Rhodothermaceae bacterium]